MGLGPRPTIHIQRPRIWDLGPEPKAVGPADMGAGHRPPIYNFRLVFYINWNYFEWALL
jgi:hypothetical protein